MHRTHAVRQGWRRFGGMAALVAVMLAVAVPVLAADNLAVPATTAGVPQRVRFTGNGFAANETISFWMTAPDRTVIPLDSAQADNLGAVAVSVALTSDGMWQVTAHGLQSRREIISRYAVGQATVAAAADVTAIATGTDATAQAGGSTFPHVLIGQAVTVLGSGFGAGESISLWMTAPGGDVRRLDGAQAESNGQFTARATFDTSGLWHVTAHGLTSGHENVSAYTVDAAATSTPAPSLPTAVPIVLPTSTPLAGMGDAAGIGQLLVTPSAAQLTPPALAVQPPNVTPSP